MSTTTSTYDIGDTVHIIDPAAMIGRDIANMQGVNRDRDAGLIPDTVTVIDTHTFEPTHEYAGRLRLTVRWTGIDGSGWFAEYRDALTLADNVTAVGRYPSTFTVDADTES